MVRFINLRSELCRNIYYFTRFFEFVPENESKVLRDTQIVCKSAEVGSERNAESVLIIFCCKEVFTKRKRVLKLIFQKRWGNRVHNRNSEKTNFFCFQSRIGNSNMMETVHSLFFLFDAPPNFFSMFYVALLDFWCRLDAGHDIVRFR